MRLTRRDFSRIAAFTCLDSLATLPLAALGQSGGRVYRVGILGNQDGPPWEGFRQGMRDLGYVDGRNIRFEWRWSDGFTERLPAFAADLVQQNVDVIVASGNQATMAAKNATSTIPIVMAVSGYPDQLGLVQSLGRPGGNVTGLSNLAVQLQGKRLELLKEAAPRVSRIAWFRSATNPFESSFAENPNLVAMAEALGVTYRFVEVRSPGDFPAAFAAAVAGKADAVMALGNPTTFAGRHLIAEFALNHRFPGIFEEQLFVEAGGLMSYGPSFIDMFRRAATYVDRIFKGAKPVDLPIEQPTSFELIINLKTAKALGLAIPPAILLRASKVIR
jgi:putative tryptophan/tyrosine transport system substrate-binding protein